MAPKNKPSSQATVLIIDDSTVNRELCQICLEETGFRVHLVENGQQGLNAIRQIMPDVVLLDIMMPFMDGFQVLEQIKANPVTREIPVLVHSAYGESAAVVKALELGACDFLKKPFNVDELIARIKNRVAFKQNRDEIIRASTELIRRQHDIDAALEKWGQEAEVFRKQCEKCLINILSGTDMASQLELAMASSELARRLINQIVNLSGQRLPEYNVLN